MKHINKIFLFTVFAIGLATTGCKKYLDVNNDPNRVTDSTVTGELIFTQAENAVGVRQASGDWGVFDQWIGYFSSNGDFAPQLNIITYNVDFSFSNNLWANHYNVLFDLYLSKKKALASGDTLVAGASMVLSAKLWQELVDVYGNVPYSQAFQTPTNTTPAYDKATDIYKALQASLDSAITYLGNVPGVTAQKAWLGADKIAAGDQEQWIRFANTLKLRLLIRQSEVSGFDPSAEMAKIIAKGGVLMAGQSIAVNPGYSNDVNKQSPFYANFGWSPTGTKANTSLNANEYIISQYEAGNDNDPRELRFFYTGGFSATAGFVGNAFGAPTGTLSTGASSSYYGPALVGNINASNQGDGSGAKQNQWIYPSYESMFLWAEAVARGWAPGNAATAYHDAMLEAFTWLGVPDPATSLDDYITNNNPDVADFANAGATPESMAKFIAYQKYLSLVGIDPYEAYMDQNRLHFLTDDSYLSQAQAAASKIPTRLLYPQSEYTANAANVNAQGSAITLNTKQFWQP